VVLCVHGNEHNVIGISGLGVPRARRQAASPEQLVRLLSAKVRQGCTVWFDLLASVYSGRACVLPPPPPKAEDAIRLHPGVFVDHLAKHEVAPADQRVELWRAQVQTLSDEARQRGFAMIDLPAQVSGADGLLASSFSADDPTHGNEAYGALVLERIAELAMAQTSSGEPSTAHPYADLPPSSFWKRAVASVPADSLDPVLAPAFRIRPRDKVATAGSCFAQHISKRLRSSGYSFLVTEPPQSGEANAEARGFYDFSARYGNLYTARQLRQLFERAFGRFAPVDRYWELPGGRFCDPFRPRIEPEGFASVKDLVEDRKRHFAAVRRMFKQLDVFVFTLGLTECWASRKDGAVFPLAPGVAGGKFDPEKYEFLNLGVEDVVADLKSFLAQLREVNPKARLLLTVSPVPLIATYERQHVLVSTTYSKSVLRVAADIVSKSEPGTCYFPSYEIITGNHARGRYFEDDLRSVTSAGVDHVMAVFMNRMATVPPAAQKPAELSEAALATLAEVEKLAEVECDEEVLDR
jgi:hypothetical protein